MRDTTVSVFESMRRGYRHARTLSRLRRDAANARRQGRRVVHMLHVRKTGGVAVKTALESAQIPPGLRLMLHGHGISLRDVPAQDEVFFFVRDPVARFVSGFEMRRRVGHPRPDRPWTPAERRAFLRFDSAQALAVALRAGDRSTRAAAEHAMRNISHVRSHLADWLVSEEELRSRQHSIVFVGWQERLEDDFRALLRLLGLPPTTALPSDPYRANRAAADDQQRALSPDAVDTIRAWYADDYRLISLLGDLGLIDAPGFAPNGDVQASGTVML